MNHERQTAFAAAVAAQVVGKDRVDTDVPPVMGAEDFSFMLEARPGAFIFVGNGDSAGLHHPAYNFNDEVIPVGTSYWVKLVETALRGLTPSDYCAGLDLRSSAGELRRLGDGAAAPRQQVGEPCASSARQYAKSLSAAAFDRGERDRGEERQACTTSTSANISISRTCFQLVAMQDDRAADQQRAEHRLPERREVARCGVAPPLAVRTKGRRSLIRPKPTARATVHCTDMAANTAPSIWPRGMRDAQPIERDEMQRPTPRRRRGSARSESCREWRCRRRRRTAPRSG